MGSTAETLPLVRERSHGRLSSGDAKGFASSSPSRFGLAGGGRLDLVGKLEVIAPLQHSLAMLLDPNDNVRVRLCPLGRELALDDPHGLALLCMDEEDGAGFRVWDQARRPRRGWLESDMSYWGRLVPRNLAHSWNRELIFASLQQKPYAVVYLVRDPVRTEGVEQAKTNLQSSLRLHGLEGPVLEISTNLQQLRFLQSDMQRIRKSLEGGGGADRIHFPVRDIADFERPNQYSGYHALSRCHMSRVPFLLWILILGLSLLVLLLALLTLHT